MELKMIETKLECAILNNAKWCLDVWGSHSLRTMVEDGLYCCPEQVPDFYPNIITTKPGTPDLQCRIANIVAQASPQKLSAKDSYDNCDFASLGFKRLFNAQWIYRNAGNYSQDKTALDWYLVKTPQELELWEASWDPREPGGRCIFRSALLAKSSISFWMAFSKGKVMAGYVANITDDVVGISNIFGAQQECIAHCGVQYADRDIVGYENNLALSNAINLGFEIVGDLSVWIR
jgi:hypothetical protein